MRPLLAQPDLTVTPPSSYPAEVDIPSEHDLAGDFDIAAHLDLFDDDSDPEPSTKLPLHSTQPPPSPESPARAFCTPPKEPPLAGDDTLHHQLAGHPPDGLTPPSTSPASPASPSSRAVGVDVGLATGSLAAWLDSEICSPTPLH